MIKPVRFLWFKILICGLYTFPIDGLGGGHHSCTLSVKGILCDHVLIFVTNQCIEVSVYILKKKFDFDHFNTPVRA